MTNSEFFYWLRSTLPNGLSQAQVDSVNRVLSPVDPADLKDILMTTIPSALPPTSKPKITKADIISEAKKLGVEPATLKAVIDVEALSSGFDDLGRPTILFERHKMWKYLGEANYITKREQLNALFPDICSSAAGAYNVRPPYEKLDVAKALHWEAAHKSTSWGLGQVMGFNAASLGYPSLKSFIADMYESEAKQLDAMCRFIKVNNLVGALKRHDWAGFARGYNGSNYAINKYDVKLAAAYALAKRQGW